MNIHRNVLDLPLKISKDFLSFITISADDLSLLEEERM